MKTLDLTKLGIVLALASVVGVLAYLGKDAPYICAVLSALVAGALGFLKGPTQAATDVATLHHETTPEASTTDVSIPITHEDPK